MKEFRGCAVQSPRQGKYGQNADVAFATFNAANIMSVQPRPVRELFLAEVAREPQLPDGATKGEKVRITFHHNGLRWSVATIYTLSV